jgi:hypothetical protein
MVARWYNAAMGKLLAIAGALVTVAVVTVECLDGIGSMVDAPSHPIVAAVVCSLLALFMIVRISLWLDRR